MTQPAVLPILAATTAAQALVSLAMLAPAAIAPEIARSLALPPSFVGWWISLAYGGAMLTSVAAAAVVRKLGAARTTQLALGLVTLGSLSAALAWPPALVAGALICGLGYGLTNPAASHLLARAKPTRAHNLIYSIKQTGVPIGGTVAGLMCPPLALAYGWPAGLAAVAVLAVGLAVILVPARPAWDDDRVPGAHLRAAPFSGLGEVLRDPRLRALSLTGFSFAAVQLSLSTFLVTMLVTDLRWSLVEAGVLLSSVQIAGVTGRILLGSLADRIGSGRLTLMGIGAVTALFSLASAFLAPHWPAVAVFALLIPFGAVALGWNGIYLAEVAHAAPPGQSPRFTGLSLFFTYGGVLVGPPTFAALEGLVGSYTVTYGLAALPAVVGAALLMRRGAPSAELDGPGRKE